MRDRVSDAGGAVVVFVARSGSRCSSQSRIDAAQRVADLREAAGEVEQHDEQADARREEQHRVVVGPERRAARSTHSAPVTAPARLPSPPITAIATRPSESATVKNRSENPMVTTSPPSNAPPSPAMKPPSANAVSLARVGETVSAAAAGSFSRTPMIMRPMPVRRRCPTTTSTITRHASTK